METQYLRVSGEGIGADSVQCQVSGGAVPVRRGETKKTFRERRVDGEWLRRGKSLTVVVWPGKESSGEEIVCDTYLPETVEDVGGLKQRASLYGCGKELDDALRWLKTCLKGLRSNWTPPLVVILLARRPIRVIGSESPIELCPYVVNIVAPELFADGAATQVRAAAHRSAITRGLLARMAGRCSGGDEGQIGRWLRQGVWDRSWRSISHGQVPDRRWWWINQAWRPTTRRGTG